MSLPSDLEDPLPFAQALIRRMSVTPVDDGALDLLGEALAGLGFRVSRHRFGAVENLYARLGATGPNVCFAGHTDVVPPGEGWSLDPFAAEVRDGWLIGRGAADMKGAIAAMVAACAMLLREGPPKGSISFLITGDEEGPAIDGTAKLLAAIAASGERIDCCLVGEPTSVEVVGDVIKNGRRGSLNALVTAHGRQGHVAYPRLAANPVPALLDWLHALRTRTLDEGADGFEPSNLEVTTIDVDNPAHNVIPARASAKFNIRFNTRHSGASLLDWIERVRAETAARYPAVALQLDARVTGEAFYTPPGPLTDLLARAVTAATGRAPALSTSGGTSDARFIKDYCPVAEIGLQNATAHMADERVAVEDMRTLARIYRQALALYLG